MEMDYPTQYISIHDLKIDNIYDMKSYWTRIFSNLNYLEIYKKSIFSLADSENGEQGDEFIQKNWVKIFMSDMYMDS